MTSIPETSPSRSVPLALAGLLALSLTACFASRPSYEVALQQVERPADASERYGPIQLHAQKDGSVTKYSFSDELIDVLWLADSEGISFDLKNKTDHSIKIAWDEAAFVDTGGQSHRVIHTGVRLMDKGAPQAPSVVVRGGRLSDRIVPADNIYFESGKYGGWRTRPLVTQTGTVQVLLPLDVEGTTLEYVFVFSVSKPVGTPAN